MPNVNIALDLFGIVVILIVLFSCLGERLKKETDSSFFIFIMLSVAVAILADIAAWIGEGDPSLASLSTIGNTVALCSGYLTTFFFILYLYKNLLSHSKAAAVIVGIFGFICFASIILTIIFSFNGFLFSVNAQGHYVHDNTASAFFESMRFPALAFLTTIVLLLMAKNASAKTKFFYLVYISFPTAGVVLDFIFHGISLTYIGMVTSIMVIYTNIYLQKRRLISEQRTALMISQINPHFMYNTLSAIAALCDINPQEAKALTVEFSTFLRQNLETLSSNKLVSIERELEHVGCYLKIEKARFNDKVNVEYSLQCEGFMLPALTVQPIVENAVKHGITKKPGGGTVKISTYQSNGHFIIEVKDDGVGFDEKALRSASGAHIGLDNVRNRIRDMCGGTLKIKSMPGVGTRVTISIPARKSTRGQNYEHLSGR